MSRLLFLLVVLLYIPKTEAQPSVLQHTDSILASGDYQKALTYLTTLKPQDEIVLNKVGLIYQHIGNHTKAIQYFTKANTLVPSIQAKERIGKSYQLIGNSDKAIAIFKEVLIAQPTNLLLKYNLAKLYMAERKYKAAEKLFIELTKADPSNPNFHFQLGLCYEKMGQKNFHKGLNSFLTAYKVDSLHLKSIYNLAKAYEKLKFKDSTKLFINKGIGINPLSVNFNQLKVKESFRNKNYDTTLVYLKKLEELQFKTKFTYMMYGLTYMQMEDFINAKSAFEKAKRLDYRDGKILFNLGLAYLGLEEYKNAELNFMISIRYQEAVLDENFLQLGLVQLKQNKLQLAIRAFEEGVEDNSQNQHILFQLAMLSETYYKDKKIALRHYENYIKRFENRDEQATKFAKQQIKAIKTTLFMEVEKSE